MAERSFAQMAKAMRVGLVGFDRALEELQALLYLAEVHACDAQQCLSLCEGRITVEGHTRLVPGRLEIPAEVIMCNAQDEMREVAVRSEGDRGSAECHDLIAHRLGQRSRTEFALPVKTEGKHGL